MKEEIRFLTLQIEASQKEGGDDSGADQLGVITAMRRYHQENEALREEKSQLQDQLQVLSQQVTELQAALRQSKELATQAEQQENKAIRQLEEKLTEKAAECERLLAERDTHKDEKRSTFAQLSFFLTHKSNQIKPNQHQFFSMFPVPFSATSKIWKTT